MKVALLTAHSRVSPVFEATCRWLMIEATEHKQEILESYYFESKNETDMANELLNKGIQLLVCGAIPYYLERLLVKRGCNVFSFIAGDLDKILQALRDDQLSDPKFKMPGCKRRMHQKENNFCHSRINN